MNTHRTINFDIYSSDYWQRKVDVLIKEKKNILKVTEQHHLEIRRMQSENLELQHLLRERERQLEHIIIENAIGRQQTSMEHSHKPWTSPYKSINEENPSQRSSTIMHRFDSANFNLDTYGSPNIDYSPDTTPKQMIDHMDTHSPLS